MSATILRRLVNLKWAAHKDKDLEGGLTPWHTIYVSKSNQAYLQRHNSRYNLLMGGDMVRYVDVENFGVIYAYVSLPVHFS